MEETVEHLYFNWLCARVVNLSDIPNPTYWKVLAQLHRTEFVWVVMGDDNRAEDGKELRREFIFQAELPDNPEWRAMGCSCFEMLIAFARRAEFQDETPTHEWFWEFMRNLDLTDWHDDSDYDENLVDGILEEFIWRTYLPNGAGGLFPIDNPGEDQRQVEIWYQFCEYLVDQNRLP